MQNCVTQRVVAQEWIVAGQLVSNNVVRSQSGRVVKQHTGTGSTTCSSTYGYGTAGRLVSAAIPGHQFTYAFGSSGGCGPNAAAGMSGNRTGLTDVWTAPGNSAVTTSTASCYDWADRLLSSTVTGAIPGATTVADGLTAAEITYDARGNTKRLGDMQFFYDAANTVGNVMGVLGGPVGGVLAGGIFGSLTGGAMLLTAGAPRPEIDW